MQPAILFRWRAFVGFPAALRLFALLASVDFIWLAVCHEPHFSGFLGIAHFLAPLLAILLVSGCLSLLLKYWGMAWFFYFQKIVCCSLWIILFVATGVALGMFSYLCVPLGGALFDGDLKAADVFLGFDWRQIRQWTLDHPGVRNILVFAYGSVGSQVFLILMILSFFGKNEDILDFYEYCMFSAILCSVVSIFIPANSLFTIYEAGGPEAAGLTHFLQLRNHTLHGVDLSDLQGLVSFPSFHTILAIGLVYAVRNVSMFFGAFATLNFLMILSTPTEGGHYLLDIAGGLIVALSTIAAIETLKKRASTKRGWRYAAAGTSLAGSSSWCAGT